MEDNRDWEEVLSLSQKRAPRAPEDDDAWYNQGHALRELKKDAEAEKVLRKAVELLKDKPSNHVRYDLG